MRRLLTDDVAVPHLPVGGAVEVWSPYTGRWCAGFTVHAAEPDGCLLRRASDGAILPVAIGFDRLRRA